MGTASHVRRTLPVHQRRWRRRNEPATGSAQEEARAHRQSRTNRAGQELTLNGKVPTFKGGQVQVFRKSAGKSFRLYKRTKASPKTGAFGRPLAYTGTAKTCFQVVAPETKKYVKTVKFLGCFTKP